MVETDAPTLNSRGFVPVATAALISHLGIHLHQIVIFLVFSPIQNHRDQPRQTISNPHQIPRVAASRSVSLLDPVLEDAPELHSLEPWHLCDKAPEFIHACCPPKRAGDLPWRLLPLFPTELVNRTMAPSPEFTEPPGARIKSHNIRAAPELRPCHCCPDLVPASRIRPVPTLPAFPAACRRFPSCPTSPRCHGRVDLRSSPGEDDRTSSPAPVLLLGHAQA
ncbi:uncharacterized protein LOC125535527 [Triticum urartu]|uniref:uncharacterized protein LOC125535527 n=1 Tax=Triticum urartu TaxID=4572 RepID=UPI0020430FAB|nr:uncharacterized protein LOC125535527 [Triticum urartu]